MHKKEIRELLCSMLIGDGHISKRERDACFIMEHSINQEDYVSWKSDLIDNIFIDKGLSKRCKRRLAIQTCKGKHYQSYRSVLYWKDYFKHLRKWTYTHHCGKEIKDVEYLLSQLHTPQHLAIWMGDDGGYVGRGRKKLALFTYGFTKGQSNLARQWFKQHHGFVPELVYFKPKDTYYIKFDCLQTKHILDIILPELCHLPSMCKKFSPVKDHVQRPNGNPLPSEG